MPKPSLTMEDIKPTWTEPKSTAASLAQEYPSARVYDEAIKKSDWHAPENPTMASQHDVMTDHAKKGTLGQYFSTVLSHYSKN